MQDRNVLPLPDKPERGAGEPAHQEGRTGSAADPSLPGQRWFGLAIHALVILASDGGCCPSLTIGRKLQADPTLLRKIMSRLAQAGVVETREGRDGGYRLALPSERLTLADVYRALRCETATCSVLRGAAGIRPEAVRLQTALSAVADELDGTMMGVLGRYTIADMAAGRPTDSG